MRQVDVQHSDFLTEIIPYYEVSEEPIFVVGDPFGINRWCGFFNKIRKNTRVAFDFSYPFFLDKAIMYENIPIGYRYNDNIVFCLIHPQIWSKQPANHKRKFRDYILENKNSPLPDYQDELEKRLQDQFTTFKPSDDLSGFLKRQYFRVSLQNLLCDSYIQSKETHSILDEIQLVERSINFHNNPQKLINEDFFQGAYREFKKVWVDQEHRVYVWYHGFLRQQFNYPIAIHDLLFVINIMNNSMRGDKIYPLTSYRTDGAGSFHPHVNTGGTPCTGTNQGDLDRFHRLHDLQGLIDVYIQYMNRYTGDGAYQRIDYWLCSCGKFYKNDRARRHQCQYCGGNSCDSCRRDGTRDHKGCHEEYLIQKKKSEESFLKTKKRKHPILDELWSNEPTTSTASYTITNDTGTGGWSGNTPEGIILDDHIELVDEDDEDSDED